MTLEYYRVLQVDPSAALEVIQAAYRRLAKKYHPDAGDKEASLERMKEINLAYEVLGDPSKRREYDQQLRWAQENERHRKELESQKRIEQDLAQKLRSRVSVRQRRSDIQQPGLISTIRRLDGTAIIQARDGTYLGLISSNTSEPNSIINQFGNYGNSYSALSIRNKYGPYGSPYGLHSPFNRYCVTPPQIVVNGRVIGYLTVNPYVQPAIDPNALFKAMGVG